MRMTTATSSTGGGDHLTREERATLKSALAFVVLRNNYKRRKSTVASMIMAENEEDKKRDSGKNIVTKNNSMIPFCRNILLPSTTFMPNISLSCNMYHMERMLQVALAAVPPIMLHGQRSTVFLTSTSQASMSDRVENIASHMVQHFLGCSICQEDSLAKWFEECTLKHEITSICNFWLCMARTNETGDFSLTIMNIICGLIRKIYHDEIMINSDTYYKKSPDTIIVNLLFLIEALIALRCGSDGNDHKSEQVLQEFLAAIEDQGLTLPVPVREMPLFVQQQQSVSVINLSPPSKILLHLALYDLTLKLTTADTTRITT